MRRIESKKALEDVGLKEHINKNDTIKRSFIIVL